MKILRLLFLLSVIAFFGAVALVPVNAQSKHDIFEKPWTPLAKSELAAFFRQVDLDDKLKAQADWFTVGQQDLSWSPGAKLIRVYAEWEPKNLFIYYLRDKAGKYTQLEGESPPIHAHNQAYPPKLTSQTVNDYIWFFGFFVRGPEGPFLPVETAKDTFLPKGITGGDFASGYKTAYDIPRPIKCKSASGEHLFNCDVMIMYSNAMFEVQMNVRADGMVQMPSDKPVAADMNVKIAAPISTKHAGDAFRAPKGPRKPMPSSTTTTHVSGLTADAQRVYDGLVAGRDLKLDDRTSPFLAGMASSMLQRCGMPRNVASRVRLQAFTTSSAITSIMGGDYSNTNLGTALGSAAKQQALMAGGALVTNQLGCTAALDKLGERIVEIIKANSASGSRFVDSCAPVHGRTSCTCLANLARPVMPNIAQRTYHRSDIAELIQRNPMTALMVSMTCGIVNY